MSSTTIAIVVGALLAVSEALALVPAIKSNSIFQMIWNVLKILGGEKETGE